MSQETTPTIENATDTMKSLITALVPPDEIEISDILGTLTISQLLAQLGHR